MHGWELMDLTDFGHIDCKHSDVSDRRALELTVTPDKWGEDAEVAERLVSPKSHRCRKAADGVQTEKRANGTIRADQLHVKSSR